MKASPPSTSGRRGSTTTTSGSVARDEVERRAGLAGTADDDRRRSPMPSSPARLSRTRSSASTTRTRSGAVGPGVGLACGHGAARAATCRNGPSPRSASAERRSPAYVIRRGSTRFRDVDRAADAAAGRDRRGCGLAARRPRSVVPLPGSLCTMNVRADPLGPGPHPGQPEVAVGDAGRVEALAVVLDPRAGRRSRTRPTLDPDLPRGGVLDDVVERFLGDPVERLLDRQRQPLVEVALDDDRQPDPALERRRVGLERADQPVLLEVARAAARR